MPAPNEREPGRPSPEEVPLGLWGEDKLLADALRGMPQDAPFVLVGNGDDAAVIDPGGHPVVVAKDVLIEGRHFDFSHCTPEEAALKAVGVNLSDLAAMGAEGTGFLVGGVLPPPADPELFRRLMQGFANAAGHYGITCLGGDTNLAPGPVVLSVTALGRPLGARILTRAGARPGLTLSVTGPLGGSLHEGRHLRVRPRFDVAQIAAMGTWVHAMMDLSDGLARDLPRMCRASDVGARLEARAIPVHGDVVQDQAEGHDAASVASVGARAPHGPLHAALCDGEDFELLLAHEPPPADVAEALKDAGITLIPVGETLPRARGLVIVDSGKPLPWSFMGFDHFMPQP